MEKIICALWKAEGEARDDFSARLLADLPAKLTAAGARHIRLNIEDQVSDAGAALRQSRGESQHHATLQFWVPTAYAPLRADVDAALDAACDHWAAWLVVESTIIPNSDHPPILGQRTAGWAQLAFLTLPAGMAHEDWRRIWQNDHTKVAIETQANFEYVQNLVLRPLTDNAPPYVAIVEECFPESALTDPFVFFDAVGNKAKFDANLGQMMESCGRFITPGTIDVIPTSQYNF